MAPPSAPACFNWARLAACSTNGPLTITGGTLDLGTFSVTTSAAVSFQGGVMQNGAIVNNGAAYDGQAGTVLASLQGAAGLNKTTDGTLVLSGNNTYSGGTTVSAGVLQLGAATGLSTHGPLTVSGGTLDLGAFSATTSAGVSFQSGVTQDGTIVNNGAAYDGQAGAVSASLQGTAGLNKSTGGTLVLSGNNTYSGGTTISGGTLQLGNGATANGSVSGNIVDNATLSFANPIAQVFPGAISGSGQVIAGGPGALTLTASNGYSGTTTLAGGLLTLANSAAVPPGSTLNVTVNGLAFAAGIGTFNLGGLAGAGNIALANTANAAVTLQVGSDGANTTYSGTLSGAGSLTKTGSGTTTLAAANTYIGATTVQGGILVLQGNNQSTSFTAASGGTLQMAGNTFNLLYESLTAQAGGTVEYNSATINGGYLRGPGTHATLPGGTNNFNGVTTYNSTLFQQNGPANFNNFTNGGQFTNNAAMTWNGGTNATSGYLTVNSTATVQDFTNNGVVTVNSGGTLNNAVSDIVCGGGSRTTINPGGLLSANSDGSGSALDLNGALLVNNGTVSGTTNVYYGSLAQGAGTYGPVNVYNGGAFKPGNSPGAVTTGAATWNSGGQYLVEIDDATGTAGRNWNLWNVNGLLALDAGANPQQPLYPGVGVGKRRRSGAGGELRRHERLPLGDRPDQRHQRLQSGRNHDRCNGFCQRPGRRPFLRFAGRQRRRSELHAGARALNPRAPGGRRAGPAGLGLAGEEDADCS